MSGPGSPEPGEPGGRRGSRFEDFVLFVMIGAPLAWLALAQDVLAGSYDDDGVYLLGAQSLAEGRSYRALHLPLEPYQTKYPPLFPLILSLVMRVFPAFPANLPWLLVPGVLCATGAAVLWRRVLRDVLGFSGIAAAAIVTGCFLGVPAVSLSGMAMSEMVFSLFAAAAVLAAGSRAGPAPVVTGLLCGLACLTRSIGIALPLGIVGWQLARRRFGAAAVTAACFCLLLAPWWWWQALAARANGALTHDVSYAYDLSYARWLLPPADELRVVWQNLVQTSYFFATFLLPGANPLLLQPLIQEWAQSPAPAKAAAAVAVPWTLALAAVVLVVAGAVAAVRRVSHALWGFGAAYLLIVLLWPFETARFFVPVMPLLPTLAIEGVAALLRSAPARRDRVRAVGAGAFLAASLVLLVSWLVVVRPVPPRAGVERMIALAGGAGGGEGPVAVPRGPMTTLYTGRKTLRLWPLDDPLIYYPRGRALSFFYFFYRRDELLHLARESRVRDVLGSMWRLGVRRLVAYGPMDPLGTEVIGLCALRLGLPLEQEDQGIKVFRLEGGRLAELLR